MHTSRTATPKNTAGTGKERMKEMTDYIEIVFYQDNIKSLLKVLQC